MRFCVCPDSSDRVQITNNIFIEVLIILEHRGCTVGEKAWPVGN